VAKNPREKGLSSTQKRVRRNSAKMEEKHWYFAAQKGRKI